jgi:hypothetical protein
MQALATSIAFLKLELPCCPDPQWKCTPSKMTPKSLISLNLFLASSRETTSSPNLFEKIVASYYLLFSSMATLHKIYIFGAYFWILTISDNVSAVVNLIPFLLAHARSDSNLIGFEKTISLGLVPNSRAILISVLLAQSKPTPFYEDKSSKRG